MIILGIILEFLWEILTYPYYIWKKNWYELPYSDRNGFKVVFASYALMILAILIVILTIE